MSVVAWGQLQYVLAAVLLLIGLYGMLVRTNLVRKLMAMNVMQVAVIVFFISLAVRAGGTPPIEVESPSAGSDVLYANPLPHALMLTAIVVSVSTTGVALALLIRIHRRFDTLDEADVLDRLRQ
ncbi:MAG: cation:proton antiporter subunit C [Vicinamibacterales bacterium]|jgi:multicomponent Na+:H+ antiporter subunit C|nr:cation:proton antiporter subunit C [Vicinamibacterales bacterium]